MKLDAPIRPSIGAADLQLGTDGRNVDELRSRTPTRVGGFERFDLGPVRIWLKDGFIDQICVGQGYVGLLDDRIGVGSTIADVEEAIGTVTEDEMDDNLIVASRPGWCFNTETFSGQTVAQNRAAKIAWICVFRDAAG